VTPAGAWHPDDGEAGESGSAEEGLNEVSLRQQGPVSRLGCRKKGARRRGSCTPPAAASLR